MMLLSKIAIGQKILKIDGGLIATNEYDIVGSQFDSVLENLLNRTLILSDSSGVLSDSGGHDGLNGSDAFYSAEMNIPEAGEVFPGIVDYEENGVDAIGMDYSKIIPLLVEAVKELSKQVEVRSERNTQIELRNVQLESSMDELKSALNEIMLDKNQSAESNNPGLKSKSH